MLFRILVTIAIATSLLPSCKTLSNNFSDLKSDCGSDVVYGGDYLKFLSPSGVELSGSELSGMSLAQDKRTESPRFTQKGCALKSELDAVAVRSSVKDRHWGVVVSDSDKRTASSLRLKDISSWNPKFECPRDTLTKGSIRSPLSWDLNLASTLPQYAVGDRNNLRVVDSVRDQDIDLGFLENDGEHELEFTWLDPYQGTKSAKCKYQLDRTAPTLTDELNQLDETKQYRVSGGSRLRLAVQDSHAASLEYCLYRPGETCQLLKAGPETFVTFPSAGHWCMQSTGIDQAGNRSETELKCGISIAEGELALLLANLQNAKHYEPTVPLLQPILILRALKQYFALQTDEERQSVKNEMLSAAVSYGAQTYLRGMYKDRRFDTMMKFSDSWGTETDGKFEIRNEYGRVLAKQNSSDLGLFYVSSHENQLVSLDDAGAIKIFAVEKNNLLLKQELMLPQSENPGTTRTTWNSNGESFAVSKKYYIDIDSNKKLQFAFYFFQKNADGRFALESIVKIPDALSAGDDSGITIQPMHWSSDGKFAAVSSRLQQLVFRRNTANKFELIKTVNERSRDLVILQDGPSSLLLNVNEDHLLSALDLDTLQNVDIESKDIPKSNYNDEIFLQTAKNSAYILNFGIDQIRNSMGKISIESASGEILNIDRSFWKWHPTEDLVSYQTFKDISLFKKVSNGLEKLGVVAFDTPTVHRPFGALPYESFGRLFTSSSDDSIIRTWATEPLAGTILSSGSESTSKIKELCREFLPTDGDIFPWVYTRLSPYSGLNQKSGRDSVSHIYKNRFNSDFISLSAHNVLHFYDKNGNDIGEIQGKRLDFKKFLLLYTDSDHVLLINEDLDYQVIEKQNSKYEEVYEGSSNPDSNRYALKPIELLRYSPSDRNEKVIRLAETLIRSDSNPKIESLRVRDDSKFMGVVDGNRSITIYELKEGFAAPYDTIQSERDIYDLTWKNENGSLLVSLKSDKSLLYDPKTKSSTVRTSLPVNQNDRATFYDNNLEISHQFQISFLGSELRRSDFSENRKALAFTISPYSNNELISDDSIVKTARGLDAIYLVSTDLRQIRSEMCNGLEPYLKGNLVEEDWEGIKSSDRQLCEGVALKD